MYIKKAAGFLLLRNVPAASKILDKTGKPASELAAATGAQSSPEDLEQLRRLLDGIGREQISRLRISPEVSERLQASLLSGLARINERLSQELADAAERSVREGDSPDELLQRVEAILRHGASQIGGNLKHHDLEFRKYLALLLLSVDCRSFLFISEQTRTTCETCGSRHGRVYALRDLSDEGLFPPLHPNCRCSVVALDEAEETRYSRDRGRYLEDLENRLREGPGGLYLASEGASRVAAVAPSPVSAVTNGAGSPAWLSALEGWAADFGADAKALWEGFWASVAERDANKFRGIPGFLDWLTGPCAGAHEVFL